MAEMSDIEIELKAQMNIVIQSKMLKSSGFEKFGQAIDRVYGTAMTLGLKEIGLYTKALKDVTYMASQSENFKGREKTCKIMLNCLNIFGELKRSLYNEEALAKINLIMGQDRARTELLNRKEFYSINKKSCD